MGYLTSKATRKRNDGLDPVIVHFARYQVSAIAPAVRAIWPPSAASTGHTVHGDWLPALSSAQSALSTLPASPASHCPSPVIFVEINPCKVSFQPPDPKFVASTSSASISNSTLLELDVKSAPDTNRRVFSKTSFDMTPSAQIGAETDFIAQG